MLNKQNKESKIMSEYMITNEKDLDHFEKDFLSITDGKQWIENTLDLSKNWKIRPLTKKAKKEIELKSALEHMKTTFKKGDVLYTQLIKKTPNGTVYFRLRYIKDNRPYQCTYHYSKIMSDNLDEKNGYSIRMPFGNMDMGFNTVYNFCRKIWDDGYYLRHEWL